MFTRVPQEERSPNLSEEQLEFYGSMSSYEILELIYMGSSASTELLAVFISILSAYFVAAYYFGDKLYGIELILLSFIYSAFSLVTMTGIYSQIRGIMAMSDYLNGGNSSAAVNVYVGVMVMSWFFSLLFMLKRWRLR